MDERRDQRHDDEIWRSIVANYGDRAEIEPIEESSDPEQPPADPAGPSGFGLASPPVADDSFPGGTPDPTPDPEPADDPDDHFVAEDPGPMPTPAPPRLLAWTGIFGAPIVLFVLVITRWSPPGWLSLLGLVWFLAGFGYLVATMRRNEDDDWDDGARL